MRDREAPPARPAAAASPANGPEGAVAATAEAGTAAELDRLRAKIDCVDDAVLAQLNARASLVQAVGQLKQGAALPVYSAARERDLVTRLAHANRGPFPSAALRRVFGEIVSATRSLEGRLRVAYLGPEGTFGHLAARRQFGGSSDLAPVASIPEVFAAVERGEAGLGVVPVENTSEGVVTETLDTFIDSELQICAEILLRISHHLLSQNGRPESVRCVASHPQALAQCRRWLDRQLPDAERRELASTAAAARQAAQDKTVAAIGSAIAGETYGLVPVARAIQDQRDNTTRFLVVGPSGSPPSGDDLTCALFTVSRDRAGALHQLLEPFARHRVNLAAIQARPIKGQPWEYRFLLEIEGHQAEPPVAAALEEAAGQAYSCKVLGSFPRAAADRSGSAGQGASA